jgi:hypothetical protein
MPIDKTKYPPTGHQSVPASASPAPGTACQSCHLNHDRGDNNKRKRYGKEYAQNPKIPFND